MTAIKKKNAGPESKSENTDFRFSCCDPKKMVQMMQNFCGDKGKTFDCSTMMEKMCGGTPLQTEERK